MSSIQTTITPHNQQPYVHRTYPTQEQLDGIITNAVEAQKKWAQVPLAERIAIGHKFIENFKLMQDEIPLDLTLQMGRPVSQGAGEVRGLVERAEYMLSISESQLEDVQLTDTDKSGFRRFIKRVPLGVVFVIAPWNYPYLTPINSVLPAIIAGNTVLLKPSPQTPVTAERLVDALIKAGLPKDVVQVTHLSVELARYVVRSPRVEFVSFTGSVKGGRVVGRTAAEGEGFKGVALELGGKDPAYVREDADLNYTVAELVDGAFFNSGQSCCAIERIYVHESLYDEFVKRFAEITQTYRLGDPTNPSTNLGPVVSLASAVRIRKQIDDAVAAGAKKLVPEELFPIARPGTTYVAPQVLVDVDHSMDVMKEESFGPIVGIMKVFSDEEALALMNDSPYGLTASIWTNAEKNPASEKAFLSLADGLETGTVFLNRCDYLDPALAWTGAKDSGRGVSLSKFGK
ncbi:Succinate-semialdehyde dehydrogenase [NADP+] [Termitomyces sp. J132]|nr:Succinate-semialdehyde dehydrogenase [NADP+] [Termitomyces sp. J132]